MRRSPKRSVRPPALLRGHEAHASSLLQLRFLVRVRPGVCGNVTHWRSTGPHGRPDHDSPGTVGNVAKQCVSV